MVVITFVLLSPPSSLYKGHISKLQDTWDTAWENSANFAKIIKVVKIHILGSSFSQSKQKIQIHSWRLPEAFAIITKPWNITKRLNKLHFYIF